MAEPGKTEVKLEINTSEIPEAIKLLCNNQGLPQSAANAKRAAGQILRDTMNQQKRIEAAEGAPEVT